MNLEMDSESSSSTFSRCQFFVKKKNRRCRMLTKKDNKFCGEHAGAAANRIPCPLDPKHSVDADDLERHVLRCNSRLLTELPYVSAGVNSTADNQTDCNSPMTTMADMNEEQLVAFAERVMKAAETISIDQACLEHPSMKEALISDEFGAEGRKHLRQQSSILEHMERLNLLLSGACFVELGAGRARLAYWLAKAVKAKGIDSSISFVLVEKSGQRYKFENKAAVGLEQKARFTRIRCAIEDVDLRLIDQVQLAERLVGVCKHLCGSGTDAGIRSLINAESSERKEPVTMDDTQKHVAVAGAVLAPCCHHRCDWKTYVGRETLTKFGFGQEDFRLLITMSSWATCGIRPQHQAGPLDRTDVGRKCKLLLDYGRAQFLEQNGPFHASLCYFVPEDVTPENLLILVRRRTPNQDLHPQ